MSYDLTTYLNEHFPSLPLEGGLFYQWPVGIRFDLGGPALTDADFAQVNHRATSLFEAVFDPEDQCVVVAQD